MQNNKPGAILFLLGGLIIFADQGLKRFMLIQYPGIIQINENLVFGISFRYPIVLNLTVLILFTLTIYFLRKKARVTLPAVFVISGALSNIIDRSIYSGVVDYINLKFWPSFNFADLLIVVGCLVLLSEFAKKN